MPHKDKYRMYWYSAYGDFGYTFWQGVIPSIKNQFDVFEITWLWFEYVYQKV